MIFFYAFDEYTDVEHGDGAREIANLTMDAILHPGKPRPAGENPLGELGRQYDIPPLFLPSILPNTQS